MNMKKLSAFIALAMVFSLLLCSMASADVITALAIEVNTDHLEKTASYARILKYNQDSNTLTVELIAPEKFSAEDMAALRMGDSIYTGGQEIRIESISYDDAWCSTVFINGDDLFFFQNKDGDYTRMVTEDDCLWNAFAVIECPIVPSLLFLDGIDAETGNELELPAVHSAEELVNELRSSGAEEAFTVGLCANNVYVVFDGEGNLATICRFYVPWQ